MGEDFVGGSGSSPRTFCCTTTSVESCVGASYSLPSSLVKLKELALGAEEEGRGIEGGESIILHLGHALA